MFTVCPDAMFTLSIIMSDAERPTVSPSATTLLSESRILAIAALPEPDAIAVFGIPDNVKAPDDTVPDGSASAIETRSVPYADVYIFILPAPEPASIAFNTAVILVFFTAVT